MTETSFLRELAQQGGGYILAAVALYLLYLMSQKWAADNKERSEIVERLHSETVDAIRALERLAVRLDPSSPLMRRRRAGERPAGMDDTKA